MTNSNLITTNDLTLIDEEPRIKDIVLGEALGLNRSRKIRNVIEANATELQAFGPMPLVRAMVGIGSGAKRTVQEYFLNEPQALLLCMFSLIRWYLKINGVTNDYLRSNMTCFRSQNHI